jgi:S1-C subfamily serine protease
MNGGGSIVSRAGPRRPAALALSVMLALAGLTMLMPRAARGDDVSAAARGVVRVVTIAIVDDQVVGFGHGSGFAVAPNRIVTNAHVVELAERYPGNVVLGVVPSEGDRSYEAKVVAYDADRDLAMLEFTGVRLPPAALYTGPIADGGKVIALGYPGNVDLATARSATDYITPQSPIRSEGVFSGRRMMTGTQVLLHTANIARGNSGGPLLDPCGRVIGVNSALTEGEQGDANFGFAVADSELVAFLHQAKQNVQTVGTPCISIEDRLRQDSDAAARTADDAEQAQHDAADKAAIAREAALDQARDAAERRRENVMALAAVLLVGGALALGGAGMIELRNRRREAIWVAGAGGVLLIAAGIVFFTRPGSIVALPDGAPTNAPSSATVLPPGKLACHFLPDRSRVTVSTPSDVTLDWKPDGCINGRTQYVETNGTWSRILVPSEDQDVAMLDFDPATRSYSNTRYLLDADSMASLRKLRAQATIKACTTDPTALRKLADEQAAIRAALPPLPNEKLVYACGAPTAGD